MPVPPLPFSEIKRIVAFYHEALDAGFAPATDAGQIGSTAMFPVAVRSGWSSNGAIKVRRRLDIALALGLHVRGYARVLDPAWIDEQVRRYTMVDPEFQELLRQRGEATPPPRATQTIRMQQAASKAPEPEVRHAFTTVVEPPPLDPVAAVKAKPGTLADLATRTRQSEGQVLDALHAARTRGAALTEHNGVWSIDAMPPLGSSRDAMHTLVTDKSGRIRLGAIGDTHLGSKYARLDCLHTWYDEAADRGITHVLHAGNYIDGEAPFNKHDLLIRGMDAQMQYLATEYPQRSGITTLAITGADHEGWYAKREGIDVGRYAASTMAAAGREDWVDLGYMEAFIRLVHGETGAECMLCLMHPGGGSAYAISYAPQKIIEGFDGGDKPAGLFIGHYHKASYQLTRNVHAMQTGCFEDQTPFMRQRKLSAHLGGCFVEFRQDGETGALLECNYAFRNFYNRAYTNGRWSEHGPVKQTFRSVTP